jgi:hypothetical protein
MKNKMKAALTALSMAAVLVTALSCNNEPAGANTDTTADTDTTAPAAVTNLAAVYSSTGTTITVTWTKPTDSDLDHYSFLCTDTTNSGATVKSIDSVDAATTTETLTAATDSIVAGNAYRFTVYAYDASGNKSEGATASVATPVASAYTVGSIICSDGSVVTKDNYDASKMTAVAVVCGGTSASGAPLAVGLGESGSLQWAPSGTGCDTNITAIVCTPGATGSGKASTVTFTGDTYGGDNWDAVCAVDSTASANAAANYPAFNYANTYTATNCTSGWYVPSISELCTLYRNMTAVNESLSKVGGTQIANGYWSSSQSSNGSDFAWIVSFSNGYVGDFSKNTNGYVRVIRAF